jgi:cysteine synthase A
MGSAIECCSFSSRVPGVVGGLSLLYKQADLPGPVELNVSDDIAMHTARALIKCGFPVGPLSGFNYYTAMVEAARRLWPTVQVVTVFPDRMERYFSTELIQPKASGGLRTA